MKLAKTTIGNLGYNPETAPINCDSVECISNGEKMEINVPNVIEGIYNSNDISIILTLFELGIIWCLFFFWLWLRKGLDKTLYRYGRTYGGGLVKFEPNELKEIPIFG